MIESDSIFIEALEVEASIGVFEWEKKIKQKLLFDLELAVDLTLAGKSDDLANTVCYAQVSELVIKHTQSRHFDLLEALAEQVITQLFNAFPIQTIQMKLAKPGAVPEAKSVGIKLVRQRA